MKDFKLLWEALWNGNFDYLHEHWGCSCCCAEHFFDNCPARIWGGCRAQQSMTKAEELSWCEFYTRELGMTEDEFFNVK